MSEPDSAEKVHIYELMTRIKQCDERVRKMLMSGQAAIMYYSARGQEAIPAGISAHLRDDDYVVTTYRGIHDQIAKGVPYKSLLAEYLGKSTGSCKGKGGPMHITHPAVGLMVTTGVVGGGIPIANGLALAAQLQGQDRVAIANFGDGATNIGAFHESLNLAQLWKLPVVFMCQNNLYGEHTAIADHQVNAHVADRAVGYGMRGVTIDGNDPIEVWKVAGEAIQQARNGGGPTLIEAVTYRFMGHYFGDMSDYMPELADKMAADPFPAYRARLIESGDTSEEQLAKMEAAIEAELDEAVEYALASDYPELIELSRDVYAEEVPV